ncbi:hypothetical protein Leryth_009483 [Lithospermum erythrorhizon]|nr:hypothetical protein Leryth_009483 [Lithospermum erythrorhizon]
MSTSSHRRATVQPETNDKIMPIIVAKKSTNKKIDSNPRQRSSQSCCFRIPKRKEVSALKFLRFLGGKMVSGIRLVSGKRSSKKDKSSSERPKSFVAPVDSHRAEAIDDCIEFINSSSTFTRSNSSSK